MVSSKRGCNYAEVYHLIFINTIPPWFPRAKEKKIKSKGEAGNSLASWFLFFEYLKGPGMQLRIVGQFPTYRDLVKIWCRKFRGSPQSVKMTNPLDA
jgi:hypothetical protein